MSWAKVIEELERQASFAMGMALKNQSDIDMHEAYRDKAHLLIAIATQLRAGLAEEDYNGFWKEQRQ